MILLLGGAGQIASAQEPVIDPASPYRLAEGMAEEPATCENLAYWLDRAPDYDGRISMTVVGPLRESHWDGALAYLIMCEPGGAQVMCVTYAPREVDPNKSVLLAGGYQRIDKDKVMLDPCLARDKD
ncbi:hypothetical protein [Aurantimonas aggregata]|uniref:hypothetical protein n=1 Tax=Aurantimonas aggregata TaxID=2047720 RepID=UPI001FE759A7|nr:hypothetical protein [Aurantimonas aggregata]